MAVLADPKLKFPFYFPTVRVRGSSYAGTEPRIYKLFDERGKKHDAYRLVLRAPGIGEFYGVQGMTWKAPPILDDPDRTVERRGRKLRLYYDGRRAAPRRLEDQARRLLGLEHAHPVDRRGPDGRDGCSPAAAQAVG